MAYRGVDRKRFSFLLRFGTDKFEMKRFFVDCRVQLILNGGRLRNLPPSQEARIRALAIELPSATDAAVQGWFHKNVTMVDAATVEEVVSEFKVYEELGEELTDDLARRLARSCLVHLFEDDQDQSLLDFLKTPVGGVSRVTEEAIQATEEQPKFLPVAPFPESLPQVLVDLVEQKDADEHLEGLAPALATFIVGLQAGAQGEIKNAKAVLDSLVGEQALYSLLERFLQQQEAKIALNESSPRGLRFLELETYEATFDIERDEILGYCTNADQPSAVFVHPIAVLSGGSIQLLTNESRQQLFPRTGDVIAFARTGLPRQPRRGEVGVWRVADHPTEKATRFHLASEGRPVYEVSSVPFPAAEYDSVREFLKEHAERSRGKSLQPQLFQLTDGLVIGGQGERTDFTKDETFEAGLYAWHALQAIRREGRVFVIGPLPKTQGLYECAGLATAIRKLFRPHLGGGNTIGGITKAQLRELAESLDSAESGLDVLRVQRVRMEIERLQEQQEAFVSLVEELMIHPTISPRIDQLVSEEAAKRIAQKNSVEAEISRLKKERGEWEERIRKQQAEHQRLSSRTSKVVKAAFEKARIEGVSALGEVAVFQSLLTQTSFPSSSSEMSPPTSAAIASHLAVRDLAPSGRDLVSTLRSLGVSGKRATAVAATGEVALKAGLMVCISGIAARHAVEEWVKGIGGRAVLLDATIGLIDDKELKKILATVPSYDGIALLDANLSALELYARAVSDVVLSRMIRQDAESKPAIVLSISDGIASLPLPKVFEKVSISLDLDAPYAFQEVSDLDELMSRAFELEEGVLYTRLWRLAADRLREQIEVLEPEVRALVLAVLTSKQLG